MTTTQNENEPVLTMSELMRRWKCARKTILEAVHKGDLRVFKVGGRSYRITMEEVLRFEREHGVKAA